MDQRSDRWRPSQYRKPMPLSKRDGCLRITRYIETLTTPAKRKYAEEYWNYLQGKTTVQPKWDYDRKDVIAYQRIRLFIAATMTATGINKP